MCCSQGIQKAHVLCHLQYLIIYHSFAVARGVHGACFLFHFQYYFSHLPHMFCSQCIQESHVLCHFQYLVIYHTFTEGRGFKGPIVYATFNIVSVIYHT